MTHPVPAALETARLRLRPWSPGDAPRLLPVLEANQAHLSPWIPAHVYTPLPVSDLAVRLGGWARDFTEGRTFRWAMLARDDGRPLGEASMFPRDASGRIALAEGADRVELGYWIDRAATGQGLVTEAMGALLDVARALPGIESVEIRCAAANAASAAVPRRLGFTLHSEVAGDQLWRLALDAPGA